ncbi:MAG: methionine synthase [Prevotella sp.]|nr:methionine synthase [Prevotella sp.]
MQEKQLIFSDLAISKKDVFEQMGYGESTPDEAVLSELRTIIEEVDKLVRPRFIYTVVNATLSIDPPSLTLPPSPSSLSNTSPSDDLKESMENSLPLSPIIARQLKGSIAFAAFVCTAGMEFEQYQQRLKAEGDMLCTYLADALGSVMAEHCADLMEQHLQESIDKLGWKHTNRFSPGYCGWHVSNQKKLFSLFPKEHPCGVMLQESSLMVPIKSVSGVIGLGPNVKHLEYSCGLCDMKNCYKRKR